VTGKKNERNFHNFVIVYKRYFGKPEEYAVAIYSFYMCFKCRKPYFGGLKSCEQMVEEEKQVNADFKPEELICPSCSDVDHVEKCKKHGTDFIEYKCKYCCSVAQWFCFGTTHFCDPCHQKASYFSGMKKNDYAKLLPKCNGPEFCPLRIKHKPNGEECSLGCGLCRHLK